MNAYELTKELSEFMTEDKYTDLDKTIFKTCNMLRQQADEIQALKDGFNTAWGGTNNSELAEVRAMANRMVLKVEEQADRIAELSKNVDELEEELLKATHPNSEPVAWFDGKYYVCPELGYEYTITEQHPKDLGWIPLYTTPQIKELSDEEINDIAQQCWVYPEREQAIFNQHKFARAILKKASEK